MIKHYISLMRYIATLSVGLCVLAAMTGCGRRSDVEAGPIVIADASTDLTIGDIVEPIAFISLEATDSCLLHQVSRVVQTDDSYYVSDARMQQIARFGKDGKFITKIGRQGPGPDEFARLGDMDVSPDGDSVYVCSSPSEVMVYGKDGDFIRRVKLDVDVPLSRLCVLKDGFVMSADDVMPETDRFFIFDSRFNLISRSQPRHGEITSTLCPQIAGRGVDGYFLDWYNHELYAGSPASGGAEKVVAFDVPNGLKTAGIHDTMELMMRQGEVGFINSWAISGSKLILYAICSGEPYVLVYDTETKEIVHRGRFSGMILDLHPAKEDGTFVCALTSDGYDSIKELPADDVGMSAFDDDRSNAILLLLRPKPRK